MITMYQADRNFVSPQNDASLYSGISADVSGILNRGNAFNVSVDGLTATVDTGQALICGRLVEVTSPESLTIPANSSGYICIVVDLSKTNDVSGNAGDPDYSVNVNQVYVSAVTQAYVQQDDLNNGGVIYCFPLTAFSSTATSATLNDRRAVYLNSTWRNLTPANGTVQQLIYRINNGIVYINANKLVGLKQGDKLFTMPSWTVPTTILNFAVALRQENSTNGGSGTGIVQIDTGGVATLTLTPDNLAHNFVYDIWFTTSYPLN
ncbi:hypothetical protein ACKP2L_05265 [Oenococcus alcoholitolerans]|uniref:hypothetical protein n=1 Tax=Oenococcus alcoholitolerans TaxID=931074 RepID=UPI003F719380